MKDIINMKERLCEVAHAEISSDLHGVDTHELGEVIDMIKDLAEAEYYCTVTKAMQEAPEMSAEQGQYGYTPNRRYMGYSSNGSTGNSGNGGYGYNHNVEQYPYVHDYAYNPEEFKKTMRNSRMGYHPMNDVDDNSYKYGQAYSDYIHAKRNYTETKSNSAKQDMNKFTNDYMYDVITSIQEMWTDADQTLKDRMKADLQKLVTSWT